jgi:5-hydroxyisourate hydrolase
VLRTVTTNTDGRTDEPLLARGELEAGEYELTFAVGDYFGERAFLDRVPIRFSIADPDAHYHVPLPRSTWRWRST